MNSTYNYTGLQPLLFDFDEFSYTNGLYLSEKEAEFASYWNMIISSLPSYLFEINYIGRKGYIDAVKNPHACVWDESSFSLP